MCGILGIVGILGHLAFKDAKSAKDAKAAKGKNMDTKTYTDPAPPRRDVPRWVLTLEPVGRFTDAGEPERRLRMALKALWRRHRIRAVSVRLVDQDAADGDSGAATESEGNTNA